MKKIVSLLAMLVLLSSCAITKMRNQIVNDKGKVTYTKQKKVCWVTNNPSIADVAKEAGITEVVTIETKNYIFRKCATIKGN